MKLGFIGGTGNLGFGLAVRCANAGHEILIGSRSEEKGLEGAEKIKEILPQANVCGSSNNKIAEAAELLFLSIPFVGQEGILPGIEPYTRGKIVVDTTVPMVYGKPPVYNIPPSGSAAENVKRLLPEAIVVSGLHTVSAASLTDIGMELDCDALVCGDNDEAKETIIRLCGSFIPRIFNAGPLSNAQSIERMTPLVIGLNQIYKKRHIGIKLSGI